MSKRNLTYQETFKGTKAVAISNDALVAEILPETLDSGTSINGYGAPKGYTAYCTGYTATYDAYPNLTFLQTTDGYYLQVESGYSDWDFSTGSWINMPQTKTQAQAQAVVQKIVDNDQIIMSNNLFCARFADKLTAAERNQVRELQRRLIVRQEALRKDGFVSNIQLGKMEGYSEYEDYLEKLMNSTNGIGVVVSAWIIVVLSCLVIAALSTAAYYAYKAYSNESEQDVKFSKELTETLMAKLTPEEYEQLKEETKGIVTKSRIKASLSTIWNTSKIAFVAGAIIIGYLFFKKVFNNKEEE